MLLVAPDRALSTKDEDVAKDLKAQIRKSKTKGRDGRMKGS